MGSEFFHGSWSPQAPRLWAPGRPRRPIAHTSGRKPSTRMGASGLAFETWESTTSVASWAGTFGPRNLMKMFPRRPQPCRTEGAGAFRPLKDSSRIRTALAAGLSARPHRIFDPAVSVAMTFCIRARLQSRRKRPKIRAALAAEGRPCGAPAYTTGGQPPKAALWSNPRLCGSYAAPKLLGRGIHWSKGHYPPCVRLKRLSR